MLAAVLDVLAPERCAGCGEYGGGLCGKCRTAIERTRRVMRRDIPGIVPLVALGTHEGLLRRCVLALKFANRRSLARELAALLCERLDWTGAVLVPVPLHSSRLAMRGYNQAEVLARAVGDCLTGKGGGATRVLARALRRVRATAAQSALDPRAREVNVRHAFSAGPEAVLIQRRRVVLVDDVVTTGATLRACERVLRECGATGVAAICVATRP